ncbi:MULTISPECIES: BLUF domain-containing protein [unclassified Sphingomonas]|uniref:BLUF domain-containing protein n=1 Tax=unclassified Sphingomonas TaxID=196159 RepID=UPI0006FC5F3D|nr:MULTISPECIES: BLUF domain-containing protein [unclassified Sphingomonas]KQX19298.1 hypothetical protein ASD17_12190 [Sphingomonas sp. Root1294]KQY65502.1 hypothetical protein ASD39_15390 [Sphingomonas sp. Root50]KRB95199.1 hypothetical protein ASE22_04670 [Sphingomonas sp. Root720]
MLFQLTYISTASPSLILFDVETILEGSRRRNGRDDITGLLIFDGKRFLQVLEGPLDHVEATFSRIALDKRHRALVRLSSRHVDRREFGAWAMASHIVGPVTGKGDMVAQVEALTEALPDPNLRATLRGFAQIRG